MTHCRVPKEEIERKFIEHGFADILPGCRKESEDVDLRILNPSSQTVKRRTVMHFNDLDVKIAVIVYYAHSDGTEHPSIRMLLIGGTVYDVIPL